MRAHPRRQPARHRRRGTGLGQFLQFGVVQDAGAAGDAQASGEFAGDLGPLDGVDAEVRLQVEVGFDHVHGVAGAFADDLQHDPCHVVHRRHLHGLGIHRLRTALLVRLVRHLRQFGCRRPPRRHGCDGRRCRGAGRGAEVGEQDVALGGDHLPAGAQEFGDERVPVGRGAVRLVGGHGRLHDSSGRCEGTGQECSVGGADEVPVDRPAGPRRRRGAQGVDGVAAPQQPGGAHRLSGPRESGEGVEPAAQSAVGARLAGDRAVRAVAEDPGDQPGEDRAGARLDEDARAGLVHRLDLGGEGDRGADLGGEFGAHPGGVRRVGRGGAVGPHGELGRTDPLVREDLGESFPRRGHERAVEGAGHGDAPRPEPGRAQESYGRLDVRRRPRNHRLFRRVEVGDDDRGGCSGRVQGAYDGLGGGADGGHGARVVAGRGQDRAGPLGAQLQQGLGVECAGRGEGGQFAVAVPGGLVGVDPGRGEEGVGGQARDAEGGLCGPGVGEGGPVPFAGGGVEGGRRVDGVGVGAAEVQVVPQSGEVDEEVGEHSGALAALAGEEEGDLALDGVGDVDPGGRIVLTGQEPSQLPGEFPGVAGHDRGPYRCVGGVGAVGRGEGEVAQAPGAAVGLCGPEDVRGVPVGGLRVPAPEEEQFGRPGVEGLSGRCGVGVRGQDRMEVGAAEAERADPGEAFGGRCRPGAGAGVEDERAAVLRPGRVGPLEVEGGRGDPGVQGEGGLDQAGESGGALGVPDLRLDRAERAAAAPRSRLGEHLGEYGEFGTVADDGPGAVRLDEADVGG